MLTIDANVFVSAAIAAEIHHKDSSRLLAEIRARSEVVRCLSFVIPETVAAIVRPTGDIGLAERTGRQISAMPGIRLLSLTTRRSRQSARLAAGYRLRGADSVYAQIAIEVGATLVTWDTEMLTRAAGAVPTMTPTAWLADLHSQP